MATFVVGGQIALIVVAVVVMMDNMTYGDWSGERGDNLIFIMDLVVDDMVDMNCGITLLATERENGE